MHNPSIYYYFSVYINFSNVPKEFINYLNFSYNFCAQLINPLIRGFCLFGSMSYFI